VGLEVRFGTSMLLLTLLAAQAATPPDISIKATVQARSMTVEQSGSSRVTVTANGQEVVSSKGAGDGGRRRVSNPRLRVDIEARVNEVKPAPGTEVDERL
jgi:hypothetical protein